MRSIYRVALVCAFSISLAHAVGNAPQGQKGHFCEADARKRADKLLRLHFADDSNSTEIKNLRIEEAVTVKAPVKNTMGKGRFDVLEVHGWVYRARYRMRFLYAQIKDQCALMGQEILELSSPY